MGFFKKLFGSGAEPAKASSAPPPPAARPAVPVFDASRIDWNEAAQADFLITGNLKHFPNHWGSTLIVTPRQLLDRLRT